MTNTKHTPGPWRFVGDGLLNSEDRYIVGFNAKPGARAISEPDARLIAKAPELLTAAQHAFSLLCKLRDEYGSVAQTPLHKELGRVIAEATGDELALKALAKMNHRLPPGTSDPRD